MFGPVVVLKYGSARYVSSDVLASSTDPRVLVLVKNALLDQAAERRTEAVEFGDEVLAFVEAERAASLRRLLDRLIPDGRVREPETRP
jgi:hypothetical protein